MTSTGNRYQPVLLRAATSTGQTSDQYWLLFPPCAGVWYGIVIQSVVLCSLGAPFPSGEKEISPRSGRRILGEILKIQVRSEPPAGLLRGVGANDAQEADVRGVVQVEGA